jgi:flagellin
MPRINHNIPSMITAGSLKRTERNLSKTLEKLSTGLAINRASDDAAGLSVSEQLRTQVRGLTMGNRNIMDGVSLINIAEGAMVEIEDMLHRMRELSIQAATDTLTGSERQYIQIEVDELLDEIDRISTSTQYNKMNLLDGSAPWSGTNSATLHVGPNNDSHSDIITVSIDSMSTGSNGLSIATVDMTSSTGAQAAITTMDSAIGIINATRAEMGAITNRLEHALNNQENIKQNVSAAESIIRDVDFATETSQFTKHQILQQSATSMLSQANSLPNNVLSLLQS